MAINLMAPVSDAGTVSKAEQVLRKLRRDSKAPPESRNVNDHRESCARAQDKNGVGTGD